MDHEPVLITTIAIGLTAAFIGGFLAKWLRLPPIVGYLVAGIAVGPYTPGLIADTAVATELAEIGVILLMFGVGIHFSIRDLLAVRSIALPGAAGQILVATLLGVGLGLALGWGLGGGLVLGLSLSVASTVVLLRALTERGELETTQGRVAIGWLIVEDLFTVLVLVLLPTVAPMLGGNAADASAGDPVFALAAALVKAAVFAALMIVAGTRVVPRLLEMVARGGSRELFTLAVLALALGIAAVAAVVFDVSFALGAFLAGVVVGESDTSHQAAADALPLRDAFAVLFFVSVGMLLDPSFLLEQPLAIVAVLSLVVVAKAVTALVIVAVFGHPIRTGLTVAAGLAQVGEFSFILGTLGLDLGLLPGDGIQLVIAGSILSIALNPFLFGAIDPVERWLRDRPVLARRLEWPAGELGRLIEPEHQELARHAILAGYGKVARMIGPALERRGFRYAVISLGRREVEGLRRRGVPALYGDAANPELLERAGVERARLLIVAIGDPSAARAVVERARAANPRLDIVVRTHGDSEAVGLRTFGGYVQPVYGERELAVQMARYSLRRFGVSATEAEAVAQGLRDHAIARPETPRRRGIVERVRVGVDRLLARRTGSAEDGPSDTAG